MDDNSSNCQQSGEDDQHSFKGSMIYGTVMMNVFFCYDKIVYTLWFPELVHHQHVLVRLVTQILRELRKLRADLGRRGGMEIGAR